MTFRLIPALTLDLEPDRPPLPGAVPNGDGWTLTIATLDELVALGPVVVRPAGFTELLPTIERIA